MAGGNSYYFCSLMGSVICAATFNVLGSGSIVDVCVITKDGESGRSGLQHSALHCGHLAVAGILLQHGASITMEDYKSQAPVDPLYGPVLQAFGNECDSCFELLCFDYFVMVLLVVSNASSDRG